MDIPGFPRRRAGLLGAAARAVAERTPQTLTVARHRAQPTAVTIVRLTCTAVFAYLLALVVTSTPRPVLAPLTALLVVQVTLYQTLRSALTRTASVVAGVLLALSLARWVGFTWWTLGLSVAIALAIGYALRLGENILEVPISAMLILSVDTRAAATERIVETLVGTAAGLAAGFMLARPKVEPAEEAVAGLCAKMAELLGRIAQSLSDGSVLESAGQWLSQARSLGTQIRRVDDELRQAEDSIRLNPRSVRQPLTTVTLRESLETLEHETTAIRVLARSLADIAGLPGDDNPLNDLGTRERLSDVLGELASAVRAYGRLATEPDLPRHEIPESELERHLAAARGDQDQLSELLGADPAARPVGWPLRGELISHLDRLRNELQAGKPDSRPRRRERSRRRPRPAGRWQPRSPTRVRRHKR